MVETALEALGARSKSAARVLATASTAQKNDALEFSASAIEANTDEILSANVADVAAQERAAASSTVIDRLRLTPNRLAQMSEGLRSVAALVDPIGEIVEGRVLANGLEVRRVRVPLGVVGIVYENRPNVTSDSAALCVKSGNATLLRGSSGALESNRAVAAAVRSGVSKAGLPKDSVILVEDVRRETVEEFVRLRGVIDCLIPRGGHSLVSLVIERATVPYVIDGDGNCHIYIDESADLDMAERIVVNAKMQRPSVCNAVETLLVHRSLAESALPRLASALEGVELVGDETTRSILPSIAAATEEDYATEFLALKLAIAVVDDIGAAIDHIAKYSSGHSEAIVTSDRDAARRFTKE
ncbi:MAG TPA: glutamate-5-semialdehyde dehydrogenase, partial [Acidimicrobiales bacterium]|nr:glutamate-5-semialdehyde dehydrogenase [Acidimicrobiales bacterium]